MLISEKTLKDTVAFIVNQPCRVRTAHLLLIGDNNPD